MASIQSQVPGEIQTCKAKILALQESTKTRKKSEAQAKREEYAEGLAKIFVESFARMLTNSKKKVVIITTAPSGTWPSQEEPVSGSGIEIG